MEMTSPVLSCPERIEFKCTTQCNDQQQAADQAANQSRCDHLPGHRRQTVSFITAIETVLLPIAPPRLKDAQVGSAVEVSRLADKAVFLIWAVGAFLLVVTPLRSWVTCPAATLTGILSWLAQRAFFLISSPRTMPVTITALQLRVTALVCATWMLTWKAVPLNLQREGSRLNTFSVTVSPS